MCTGERRANVREARVDEGEGGEGDITGIYHVYTIYIIIYNMNIIYINCIHTHTPK